MQTCTQSEPGIVPLLQDQIAMFLFLLLPYILISHQYMHDICLIKKKNHEKETGDAQIGRRFAFSIPDAHRCLYVDQKQKKQSFGDVKIRLDKNICTHVIRTCMQGEALQHAGMLHTQALRSSKAPDGRSPPVIYGAQTIQSGG